VPFSLDALPAPDQWMAAANQTTARGADITLSDAAAQSGASGGLSARSPFGASGGGGLGDSWAPFDSLGGGGGGGGGAASSAAGSRMSRGSSRLSDIETRRAGDLSATRGGGGSVRLSIAGSEAGSAVVDRFASSAASRRGAGDLDPVLPDDLDADLLPLHKADDDDQLPPMPGTFTVVAARRRAWRRCVVSPRPPLTPPPPQT